MSAPIHHALVCCRICSSEKLEPLLDLGRMPLANAFIEPADQRTEERYPLELVRCPSCELSQLSFVVDPGTLFSTYRYTSSSSRPLHTHFEHYAAEVADRFLARDSLVVEIGSNDGILLAPLAARSFRVLGIEPAANIAALANERGLPTVNEFFGLEVAGRVRGEHGPAAAVLANNVLAHIDDLDDVVAGLDALLAPDGVFVAEVPYLLDLIEHVEYDTIYHEHLSYFALAPLARLFGDRGFQLFDVERLPIHGGSVRVYASRAGRQPVRARLTAALNAESGAIGEPGAYVRFAARVARSRDALREVLEASLAAGRRVAGLGATAKGNTLLNYCGLGPREVAFIGDSTPLKHGLLTPGTRIPVVPEEELLLRDVDDTLLLAWNYANAIIPRYEGYLRRGGRFIHPIPEARLIIA